MCTLTRASPVSCQSHTPRHTTQPDRESQVPRPEPEARCASSGLDAPFRPRHTRTAPHNRHRLTLCRNVAKPHLLARLKHCVLKRCVSRRCPLSSDAEKHVRSTRRQPTDRSISSYHETYQSSVMVGSSMSRFFFFFFFFLRSPSSSPTTERSLLHGSLHPPQMVVRVRASAFT